MLQRRHGRRPDREWPRHRHRLQLERGVLGHGPNYIYDTFVYWWTAAVAGRTPEGVVVHADSNGDGLISMKEAFTFAQTNDHETETPQYVSTPVGLGTC